MLLLAALTALATVQPDRALLLIKRYGKRYVTGKHATLLTALALAQQDKIPRAWSMLCDARLTTNHAALAWFVGDDIMADWLYARLHEIRLAVLRIQRDGGDPAQTPPRGGKASASTRQVRSLARSPSPLRPASRPGTPRPSPPRSAASAVSTGNPPAAVVPMAPPVAALPRLEARIDIGFELANPDAIEITGAETQVDPVPFRLRSELVRLSLFEGFDELLCLPALQGVEAHWYQVETVRKVLKQYRGRVLLADEVGLGKTIEAGMILKEYILRGMAERILILTPASLVGQWRDEMAGKFGIEFATSHDQLLRGDPQDFLGAEAGDRLDRIGPPQGPRRNPLRPELRRRRGG
jgi:hypothetical protein